MHLYPLKFVPIYKEKLWGGEKIKQVLNKDYGSLPNCGESWEISGVEDNISVVSEGSLKGKTLTELVDSYKGDLVGKSVYEQFGSNFPLLVKFIDANQDLSIQVHPGDKLARERHNGTGKTEMWYILQSDTDAELISGFNRPVDKETYLKFFEKGQLTEILNREKADAGDVFFIPAGRVHTIGKGLLLAEIQQTSDITYRIYDFDRVDAAGNKRELHVDQALDAIDYAFHEEYKTAYNREKDIAVPVARCDYFHVNKLTSETTIQRQYYALDSFVVLVCVGGELNVITDQGNFSLSMGETLLIPSVIQEVTLEGTFELLEAYIPS